MHPIDPTNPQHLPLENARAITRRHFFGNTGLGLGAVALGAMMRQEGATAAPASSVANPMAPKAPHFAPKAKRVIYLHMAGAPPQHDTFDPKPKLNELDGKKVPKELIQGEQFAFIVGRPVILASPYKFRRYGNAGTWVSELLPHFGQVVDDVAMIKSMKTDQFNHAPAQLFVHTGQPRIGNPSMGAWATYGLGTMNQNLPGFVVLVSGGNLPSAGKSAWGSGFLPTVYQGVQCRTSGDPVLYLSDPKGMNRQDRRRSLDALRQLNQFQHNNVGDSETLSRIGQYELAFRMQASVPGVMDISKEPDYIHQMYGTDPGGESFANNCLLARRMAESGVRFVQLYDWGWDVHGTRKKDDLIHQLPEKCKQIDRPIAALIKDLKQRGMLEDTLVIWSGEFGRTCMRENRGGSYGKYLGRDHHPHCFSMWMAGGGIQGGLNYGATDELGYHVTENEMGIHDLQATILHLLGMNPHKFSYSYRGLDQRLIGPTEEPRVNHDLIA